MRTLHLLSVLMLCAAHFSAHAQTVKQDVWWCTVDDSRNAVRHPPGRAIPAPTGAKASTAFMAAVDSQYPNAITGSATCGVTSVKGYHDWVASQLGQANKSGWEIVFVNVAAMRVEYLKESYAETTYAKSSAGCVLGLS